MTRAYDAAISKYLPLLKQFGTDETPHSGRHLLDHLMGVHQLLVSWGNPADTCRAGLFHSIYGTNIFTMRSVDFTHRSLIRTAIGDRAERLAYLFCVTDRPLSFLQAAASCSYRLRDIVNDTEVVVEAVELNQLLEIEIANFLEQPEDAEVIRQIRDVLAAIDRPTLGPAARAALDSYVAGELSAVSSATPKMPAILINR